VLRSGFAGAAHVTGGGEEFQLHREMGCTSAEFIRWLPGATRHAPLQLSAGKAVIRSGEATIEISFTPAPPRRIALIVLPVLNVSFRFTGADTGTYLDFMRYFDLYTSRGGG